MTDTDELSDVDSSGGDLHNRSLSVTESHGSDYSDVDNAGEFIYFIFFEIS